MEYLSLFIRADPVLRADRDLPPRKSAWADTALANNK
jgi:hypothetical protein